MGFRIGQIVAAVSVAPDGDEGIAGELVNGAWHPLLAADENRLAQVRVKAKRIARLTGQPMRLVRFDCRTDIEDIIP